MHRADGAFIMPNAWNAGSAALLEQAGFKAIGTTSAGIAFSRALPDSAGELPFETALDDTAGIVGAVRAPVSMDAENGYGDAPEAVGENLARIAMSGAVGASIEDYSGDPQKPLYDIAVAVERIAAAKQAAAEFDFEFTLTARAECYLTHHPDPFAESVKRLNLYREAGADCLYAPGIADLNAIAALVREVAAPVNVVVGLSGAPLSFDQLQDAGVKRISIGGALARTTFGVIRKAAEEMLRQGTFNFAAEQVPDAELCELFAARTTRSATTINP
ncbi:MAG: isocitrate lyase/PEP mutase family protein [bacterium]